jgi:hypothetical protein
VAGVSAIPLDYGLVEGLSITQTRQLQVRGSILNSVIADRTSPVTYGYEDKFPLYFGGTPVFNLSTGIGRFGGSGSLGQQPRERPSGRGGPDDPVCLVKTGHFNRRRRRDFLAFMNTVVAD